MRTTADCTDGFTLLELVTVVAILGILATLAVPSFKGSVHRTRRDEAFQTLRAISLAQTTFFVSNQFYGDTFEEIGFELDGGTRIDERTIEGPVYTYTISALELDGKPRANYRAIASGNLDPSDALLDVIMIENQLTIVDG
jgi:prepilin-type N-terminal cleavage/methylation domain-containing protein